MTRRITLTGSTLRARSVARKAAIARALKRHVWPMIEDGRIRPQIYRVWKLQQAAAAHRLMESGRHIGKIVLGVDEIAEPFDIAAETA
jgi:NADPH2:quinone reductase